MIGVSASRGCIVSGRIVVERFDLEEQSPESNIERQSVGAALGGKRSILRVPDGSCGSQLAPVVDLLAAFDRKTIAR